MNRRQLLQFGATGLAVAAFPALTPLEGCTASQITNSINTVINSALAIIKVADPGASWLAGLASGIAALQQAEAQWQTGGPVTLIDDALNTISAVLAVIPVTAVYSPLISILVAGIEAVLALLPAPTPVAAAAAFNRHALRAQTNPYYGKVALNKPHFLQSNEGAYKSQWNAQATALGLAAAKI